MKQHYAGFITRLSFMTLLIGLTGWALGAFLPENTITPAFPFLLILFFIITALIHLVLLRITRLNPRRFISYFMLATFLKLFIYLAAVLIYVFNFRENILSFIVTFMIMYLIFTIFEVVFIIRQTKDN